MPRRFLKLENTLFFAKSGDILSLSSLTISESRCNDLKACYNGSKYQILEKITPQVRVTLKAKFRRSAVKIACFGRKQRLNQFLRLIFANLNFLWIGVLGEASVNGQIVPDGTLPESSQVSIEDNRYTLNGGTRVGNNLFHSLQEFSLPTGSEAFFNNPTTVDRILTRVTGDRISQIDGSIRANGTADLFLINPNGIVFGENARLDIGGSFLASTADRLVFENGDSFSSVDPAATPLLTVSVPMGLQFGDEPGTIDVRGTGHRFQVPDITFSALDRGNVEGGLLQVASGQTLALVGGDVTLDGGVLMAPEGRIEIGAVGSGRVTLSVENPEWAIDYGKVTNFRDLHFARNAAIDASGFGTSSIEIIGRQIELTDGSIVLLQNFGLQPGGRIRIRASESLSASGRGRILSQILSEAIASGRGAHIEIETQQLQLERGGRVFSTSSSKATGGDIAIRASESVRLLDFATPSNVGSAIFAFGFASGRSGRVSIFTQRLTATNGSSVSSTTFGSGPGGDVLINATESIEAFGISPRLFQASTLSSASFGSGVGGRITLNTGRLVLRDGGRVSAATLNAGNAGQITINASESVEVSGTVPGSLNPAQIISSADILDLALRETIGLPAMPSGDAGNVTISTPLLRVTDGAEVSVKNDGSGIAGTLQVNAGSIVLDRNSSLSASTQSGEGGDITLAIDGSLQLQNASQIAAEAGQSGDGGNLTISAGSIVVLQGSDINANAFIGRGGNIEIEVRGLFVSPDSRIIANSQLGIDGVVSIAERQEATHVELFATTSELTDPTTQIISACVASDGNTFVVTGNGGLPTDPTDRLSTPAIWTDMRLGELPTETVARDPNTRLESLQRLPTPIEASGWAVNADGTVELVAIERNAISLGLPKLCVPVRDRL